jgi:DNA-binding GntR family transcriptional regulator
MLNLDSVEAPPSLKDMALHALNNAILTAQLHPERIYKIDELAKSLGISKTPVREALLDLAARGFVTFLPRRGIQINTLDERDIRNLYAFRAAMETAVIRHVAPVMTDASIAQVEAINIAAKEYIKDNEKMKYLKKDREFHLFLAELTENEYLISALERVRDLVDWMGTKALLREERMMEVFVEHEKVIQALKQRDVKKAIELMEKHIIITMENVLNQLAV